MKLFIIIAGSIVGLWAVGKSSYDYGKSQAVQDQKEVIKRHQFKYDSITALLVKQTMLLDATIDEIHEHGEKGAEHAAEAFDILNTKIDSIPIEKLLEVKNDPYAIRRLIHGDTL